MAWWRRQEAEDRDIGRVGDWIAGNGPGLDLERPADLGAVDGYARREFIGEGGADLVPPETIARFAARFGLLSPVLVDRFHDRMASGDPAQIDLAASLYRALVEQDDPALLAALDPQAAAIAHRTARNRALGLAPETAVANAREQVPSEAGESGEDAARPLSAAAPGSGGTPTPLKPTTPARGYPEISAAAHSANHRFVQALRETRDQGPAADLMAQAVTDSGDLAVAETADILRKLTTPDPERARALGRLAATVSPAQRRHIEGLAPGIVAGYAATGVIDPAEGEAMLEQFAAAGDHARARADIEADPAALAARIALVENYPSLDAAAHRQLAVKGAGAATAAKAHTEVQTRNTPPRIPPGPLRQSPGVGRTDAIV